MQLRPYQNDLVEQVRQAWREGYKAPCIVLGCGGGKSCIVAEIARRTTWNGKRVLFLVHRRELVDQIFRTFVRWGVLMDLCQIGMVQTFTRRLKKLPKPALIITDENHHSLAQSYKRIYEHFSDVPRVGVTATPVRLNGDGLGDVNDKLIIGVSTKWLIKHNCLAPYDYYAPSVADLTGLHTKMGEYVASEIEKAMTKNTVFGDVIKYYRQLADGKKAVCYCSTVKHSMATAQAFCEAGISARHIDGATPKAQREQIIADFRNGKITILCNVDLISEGFDVPDCECTILLRPTHSLTLYIQQSMRCMRYKPNKRAVIIDHVGNYARHGMPDDDREWTLEKRKKPRLQNRLGIFSGTKERYDSLTEEHAIQNKIRIAIAPYCDIFRINVGAGFTKDGRYFNTGVPPGFSDLFGVRKSDGRAVFIEVKTPKGRPTEKQQKFIQMMKLNGAVAGVCRSADEAIELITKE